MNEQRMPSPPIPHAGAVHRRIASSPIAPNAATSAAIPHPDNAGMLADADAYPGNWKLAVDSALSR